MISSRVVRAAIALVVAGLSSVACWAQGPSATAYPNKAVKIVVGFTPGTVTDNLARLMAERLTRLLGQPFIVDNKPGAGGAVAAAHVARAPADGYTLLFSGAGPLMVAPVVNPKSATYDPTRDFEPISLTHGGPYVLVVRPGRFNSLADLIAKAKAAPGSLSYATSGAGSTAHLLALLLEDAAGIKLTHVPYRGSVQSLNDLVGGAVDLTIESVAITLPFFSSGKLQPLAVTSPSRTSVLPQAPTFDELGLKGYQGGTWVGFLAPLGTPTAITGALNEAVVRALTDPELQKYAQTAGMEIRSTSRAEFAEFLKQEKLRLGSLARRAGVVEQ
jgi:tripartite-type tricarboxylate transporter receptor subunit TctC